MSPHSFAAKAGRLGKSEGGLRRRVLATQKRACIAWRGTCYAPSTFCQDWM
jgi:hypothetical protein